jgi:hypothetical protein
MKHYAFVHPAAREGYGPAGDHVGWVQAIGTDGKPFEDMDPPPDSPPVGGWRGYCGCGWTGSQYYPRAEFPAVNDAIPHPPPPLEVVGDSFGGVDDEWYRHIVQAVPELVAFDLVKACHAPLTDPDLRWAVQQARSAGVSWSRIATVTGIPRADAESLWGPRRFQPVERYGHQTRPYQGRPPDPPAQGPQR